MSVFSLPILTAQTSASTFSQEALALPLPQDIPPLPDPIKCPCSSPQLSLRHISLGCQCHFFCAGLFWLLGRRWWASLLPSAEAWAQLLRPLQPVHSYVPGSYHSKDFFHLKEQSKQEGDRFPNPPVRISNFLEEC